MLKQSTSQRHTHLYDKVRRDLFEQEQDSNTRNVQIPSITTICLLQIQAYVIQMLANLPPKVNRSATPTSSSSIYYLVQQRKMHTITSLRSLIRQCMRWVLLIILFLLDNVARILNVEREMSGFARQDDNKSSNGTVTTAAAALTKRSNYEQEDEKDDCNRSYTDTNTYHDDYYMDHQQKKQYHHDLCANNNTGEISEPASPTQTVKRNNQLVSPSSPMSSPTPNFVVRQRKTSSNAPSKPADESPVLSPSRATRTGHIRSLSNNMVDKANSQQKLRRVTAQREITVQSAVLPIQPKTKHHHHHHHHTHKKPPIASSTANSVASRSSSESSTAITVSGHEFLHRPRMQKTMSLSTAQQYQQQQQQQNEVNLRSMGD
jgi:hypothetical protein